MAPVVLRTKSQYLPSECRVEQGRMYAASSHEPVIRLSERLVKMAPGPMSKVFYGLSGSDANETLAKIVWYFNNILGRKEKKKIIARERGYHGCSVISGSMTGMS